MSGPTARVLQLLSLLQAHRFWPGPELAGRLEVSERTLRRDVERLRDLGYPVDATPGVGGGYRLAAGAHLPPLVLDDEEAVAIAVGLRSAAEASIEGVQDASLRALVKLEQVLPDRLRRRVNAVHTNVVALRWGGPDGPTVSSESLALLAQACRDHEEVRFDYQRRDGEEARRLVQPHQLVSAGRRWYLVAWDCRRADWRTFRVDRLKGPKLAGARFLPRPIPGGDTAAFVARSLTAIPKAHEATVVVRTTREELGWVERWSEVDVEDAGEGCWRLRLRAGSIDWLASTVARLATTFEIEACGPAEVAARIDELATRLRRAAAAAPDG